MQVLAFLDHYGIADDDPRVNPYGGAIAVGHPLASSGVRLMTQLARQFADHPEVRYGLTAMCVGFGMGGAVVWENPSWAGRGVHGDGCSTRVLPGEVVTRALVRYVEVPGLAGRARADHPGQRRGPHQAVHVRPARAALAGRRAGRDRGAHPGGGGDRGDRQAVHPRRRRRPDRARRRSRTGTPRCELGRLGHRVFRRLHDSAGADLRLRQRGGDGRRAGDRAALPTTGRCPARPPALALPEVFLGLVPGWGGTQLLPNLVGASNAVTVILENPLNQNRTLKPAQAMRARPRRRAAGRRGLPGRVAALGGPGGVRDRDGRRGPRWTGGPAWDEALARGPGAGRRQGARRRARAVPGAGAAGAGPGRRPRRGRSRPRTRRSPTWS